MERIEQQVYSAGEKKAESYKLRRTGEGERKQTGKEMGIDLMEKEKKEPVIPQRSTRQETTIHTTTAVITSTTEATPTTKEKTERTETPIKPGTSTTQPKQTTTPTTTRIGEIEKKVREQIKGLGEKITKVTEEEREREKEKQTEFELENEEETEPEKQEMGTGPERAVKKLKEVIRDNGKKSFEKLGLECIFCEKKGHTREGCPVVPPNLKLQITSTTGELQIKKQKFVLGLMGRKRERDWEGLAGGLAEGDRGKIVEMIIKEGEIANEGNPWATSTKRRDKLRKQLGYWWAIGADRTIISWIGFGIKLKFQPGHEKMARVSFPNHRSYHQHHDHADTEHEQHIADGNFRVVEPHEVHVGNPVQVEVNGSGKKRMCVDMRYTNRFIADVSFTQETLNKHVANIIQKDMFMITTDVEKAYYQVPLHKDSQKYCGWQHLDKKTRKLVWILPTCLVFGLGSAPFYFTKIMRPVLNFMRSIEISGTNCIDDNLWAEERKKMDEVIKIVKTIFGSLGWVFNKKCVLTPSQVALYNGMWIDSKKFEIRATEEKLESLITLVWNIWYRILEGEQIPVIKLQQMTGRLQSLKLAIEGVAVFTRGIYSDVAEVQRQFGLYIPKGAKIHLSENAINDMAFWRFRLGKQNGLPIRDGSKEVHLRFYADASDCGWGAYTDMDRMEMVNGFWRRGIAGSFTIELMGTSSTEREIACLLVAAGIKVAELTGKRVRILMDSYCAVRNLIKGGGSKEGLNQLVKQWWIWCKRNEVTPLYEWIPREENQEADRLSKESAAAMVVKPQVLEWVKAWMAEKGEFYVGGKELSRVRVVAPRFNRIETRMDEMQRARLPGVIIVPKIQAPYRKRLKEMSKTHITLGLLEQVVSRPMGETTWNTTWLMEARIIHPIDKTAKEEQQAKRTSEQKQI
jgi:hypothetical protein